MNEVTKSPSTRSPSDEEYIELCYLRHFYDKADFGPADDDVRMIIRQSYLGPIPEEYKDEDE